MAKYLVQALGILNPKNVELRYFGNPKVDDCHKSPYYKGIYYHGVAQDQMWRLYSEADLYVSLQTNRACWNNPVAEAMACGCPVLTTSIGAVRDLITHGTHVIPSIEMCKKDQSQFVGNLSLALKYIIKSGYDESTEKSITEAYQNVMEFSWNKIFPVMEKTCCG